MGRSGRKKSNRSRQATRQRAEQESVKSKTTTKRKRLMNRYLYGAVSLVICVLVLASITPRWLTPAPGSHQNKVVEHFGSIKRLPVELAQPPSVAYTTHSYLPTKLHTQFELEPTTLDELLSIAEGDLYRVDIARMNLLCATDLEGTQYLDADGIEHALATLDDWAKRVAFETDRHAYRITDPRYADRYQGSEAHFRAEMLAQVLQEDLGVKYNPEAVGNFSFADPSVAFIHSMIPTPGSTTSDTSGGTCVSMPVLYVAVGRRLGYPLKLVTTDSHIFARWDGEGHDNSAWRETFNCETTNGFHRFDDEYYKTWPFTVTNHQIAVNGYLQSLSPSEEFAQFLAARGHHAYDVKQYAFAARCYENAYRYDTLRPCYRGWFLQAALRSNYQPQTLVLNELLAARQAQFMTSRQKQLTPFDEIMRLNQSQAINPMIPQPTIGPQPVVHQPFDPTQYYHPPVLPE